MNKTVAIGLLLSLFCCTSLWAQQTTFQSDTVKTYLEAVQYFEWGNYNQAMLYFEDFLKEEEFYSNNEHANQYQNAMFYNAVAAKKLDNSDGKLKLRQYVDRYPEGINSGIVWFHLGQMEYRDKQYKEAIEAFQHVKPADLEYEDLVDFRFQLAYSFFSNKDFNKAQRLFKEFKDVEDKYYHQSNYYYAYLTYLEGDYDTALQSFQRADANALYKKIAPYYITYIYYQQKKYNELLSYAVPKTEQRGLKYEKEINQLIGQTYFTAQQYNEALPYLETYVNKSTKVRKEDIYQLAFTQYQTGQYGAAVKNFEQLSSVDAEIGQVALYSLADCYLKTNQKEKARNAYAEASKLSYDEEIQETSLFNYAKLSHELGLHQNAIKAFGQFIEKYPYSQLTYEAQTALSKVFEGTNNYKEALNTLESFDQLSPTLQSSYQKMAYLRGLELHNNQEFKQAYDHFQKSNAYPIDKDIVALSNFWTGNIFFMKDRYKLAVDHFNRYLKRSPKSDIDGGASAALANYSMAYAYYKIAQWDKAKGYFNKTSNALRSRDDKADIYADALLRVGDCNFVNKSYSSAASKYNEVIDDELPGADYAAFQLGIISGLKGNSNNKVEAMTALINRYPKSIYVDDAAFEIGETYLNDGDYGMATNTFNELISRYKNSNFAKKSLLKLGLINYNLDKNEQAMGYYKQVVKKYPNTIESKEALAAIKDLYIDIGDPNGYFNYVGKIKYVNVSNAAQDSIMYLAAENQYIEGNCDLSTGSFTDYLLSFPKGNFSLPSHFYRAECLNQEEQYKSALKDYDYVIDQPLNIYTEQALRRGTRIAYQVLKDYDKAYRYYNMLYLNSSVMENLSEGLRGLMRTSYHTDRYDDFDRYANKLLSEDFVSNEDKADIFFYRGKIAAQQRNFSKMQFEFKNLFDISSNENAAEAKYMIAYMHYQNKDFAQAKQTAFDLGNAYSTHDFWVVKSFLLLADIYVETDEIFQAKATLQSIIDNYDGEELVKEAQAKMKRLKQIESRQSKISNKPIEDNYLEMDTINNQ